MEGQTNGPSVFAIQVMATEGPLLVGSTLDSHGQGWPCREWACKQASRDPMSEDCLFLPRASFYLYFIPLSPLVLFDVHEMSLNFLPRTHMSWGGNTRIVSYHIGKFLVDWEFKVWSFGAMYIRGREDATFVTFILLYLLRFENVKNT